MTITGENVSCNPCQRISNARKGIATFFSEDSAGWSGMLVRGFLMLGRALRHDHPEVFGLVRISSQRISNARKGIATVNVHAARRGLVCRQRISNARKGIATVDLSPEPALCGTGQRISNARKGIATGIQPQKWRRLTTHSRGIRMLVRRAFHKGGLGASRRQAAHFFCGSE